MYHHMSDDKYIDHTNRVMRWGAAILLRVPSPRNNKLTRAPIYKASVMWNDLLTKTREVSSLLAVKNAYSAHMIIQPQNLALQG